jgi:hypothetical protein
MLQPNTDKGILPILTDLPGITEKALKYGTV